MTKPALRPAVSQIADRTLRSWRQEALLILDTPGADNMTRLLAERILTLTQQAIDSRLLRRGQELAR